MKHSLHSYKLTYQTPKNEKRVREPSIKVRLKEGAKDVDPDVVRGLLLYSKLWGRILAGVIKLYSGLVSAFLWKYISRYSLKLKRYLKNKFRTKRNRRRGIYVAGSFAIALLLVFSLNLYSDSIAKQNRLIEREKRLETLHNRLQSLDKQKRLTEVQLKKKKRIEAQVKAENKQLREELQAKRETGILPTISSVVTPVSAPNEGNTYSYGYCTWYVKNKRPDIPNNWGDAYMWLGNAQAQGWPTGSNPKVGAIGTAGNHVVYVESVEGDTISISEMNAVGWNVVSSRTASASEFSYIY